MEIGIDSFAAILRDPATGKIPSATDRMADLLEEVKIADRVGLDVFGMGAQHRAECLDSAPEIIIAVAAARTCPLINFEWGPQETPRHLQSQKVQHSGQKIFYLTSFFLHR